MVDRNLIDDTSLVRLLAKDERTLGCPLCHHTEDSPPIPISDQLAAVFGLSGDTLARVHGDQQIKRICNAMRRHLDSHPVEEWLLALAGYREALAAQLRMTIEIQADLGGGDR